MNYEIGQNVTCNGNPQGTIVSINGSQVEVMLFSGTRLVGNVITSTRDLDIENK